MHGPATILIMAKKKAAGPSGFFDPMGESEGMAMGPMDAEMPKGGMFDNGGEAGSYDAEDEDEGVTMVQGNLRSIASKAQSIHDMSEGCELPEWVKQKITVCDSYLDSVHDYLKFNPESGHAEEPTEEEPLMKLDAPKAKKPVPAFLKSKPMKY